MQQAHAAVTTLADNYSMYVRRTDLGVGVESHSQGMYRLCAELRLPRRWTAQQFGAVKHHADLQGCVQIFDSVLKKRHITNTRDNVHIYQPVKPRSMRVDACTRLRHQRNQGETHRRTADCNGNTG